MLLEKRNDLGSPNRSTSFSKSVGLAEVARVSRNVEGRFASMLLLLLFSSKEMESWRDCQESSLCCWK